MSEYCVRSVLRRLAGCDFLNGLYLKPVATYTSPDPLLLAAVYSSIRRRRPLRVLVCAGPLEECERLAEEHGCRAIIYVARQCPEGYERRRCVCVKWGEA